MMVTIDDYLNNNIINNTIINNTNVTNENYKNKSLNEVINNVITYISHANIPQSMCKDTHIAVLFTGGKKNPIILSHGVNEYTITCHTPVSDPITIHAEMKAISNYLHNDFSQKSINSFRREKLNIFITKRTKTGKLASSSPCKNCIDKLYTFGINKIYWTDVDSIIHIGKSHELKNDKTIYIESSGNQRKAIFADNKNRHKK